MRISKLLFLLATIVLPALVGLTSCGKKCNVSDSEKNFYSTEGCSAGISSASSAHGHYIYVSSGYPTASGVGIISRWTSTGQFLDIVHDFANNAGFMPQAVTFQTINSVPYMFMLAYNGTYGEIEVANTDGTDFSSYITNSTALAAGSRRLYNTTDGGFLITRTAGVERYTSAKTRQGGSAKYVTAGACTIAAGAAAVQLTLSGVDYVVAANAAATPNNKVNLYNGATGACISGVAPTGPATTMWPVDMDYSATDNKLFVLYYPFTGATTNAQIWSFDVTASAINNGTLIYNDVYAEIATVSATPLASSSSIVFHRTGSEAFVLVGTSINSVLKLNYDGTTLTKASSVPLIYQNSLVKSISNVNVLDF